jgi:ribosome-associated protein
MLIVNSRIRIPRTELAFTFVRSSGPGGQNVNKVNSKAVLRWNALASPSLPADIRDRFLARYGKRLTQEGDLVVSSQRYRDQGRNVDDALEKLSAMLAEVAKPPKRRRPTKPTKSAGARRLESKQARSRTKQRRRMPESD